MQSNSMPKKARLTTFTAALLLVLGSYWLINTVAVAQPAPQATAPGADGAASTGANTADTERPIVAVPAGQPFEDYEASEQISEDLSVAFPVDI
ncbi:MAG: hypothetical protein NWP69_02340 [Congregibacter sp.]|nr:hypothetical protein [Congregibacter sp.]MDP5070888.1 hypothetical protein [Congregibacter sp.]